GTGAGPPYVAFEFTNHRRGEAPQEFLKEFRGFLQADAYSGFNALYIPGQRTEVGCWAHARRGFDEARTSSPRASAEALNQIAEFYRLEKDFAVLSSADRRTARQTLTAPLLVKFRQWLDDEATRALPKSPLGQAIQYVNNQWDALNRFLEDGRLNIDNN